MKPAPLRLAVVGHTNTGKTSLIRTLTRDRGFGEVADRGGTTRQVSAVVLGPPETPLIELFDSPGLENAPDLIESLDRLPGGRHAGRARIEQLINDPTLTHRFDQEARVLELMLTADVGLYVIDAREPVLEKYQDELTILAECARPLVAVLNFTASADSRAEAWRRALAEVRLHTVISFDAVVREPASERRLFEKLASQLDGHRDTLQGWLDQLGTEDSERRHAALLAIADLLLDAAACRREFRLDDPAGQARACRALQDAVRQREQACVETLLALYRFGAEDYRDESLPLSDGRWDEDLFDPTTLLNHGLTTGKHLGAGAGAGAIVDVATGGLSLGAGTLIGGLIGGGAGLARSLGERGLERLRGRDRVEVDDNALRLLAWRQLKLLDALRRRGHASRQPLSIKAGVAWQDSRLPQPLRQARYRPEWSAINSTRAIPVGRDHARDKLVRALQLLIPVDPD